MNKPGLSHDELSMLEILIDDLSRPEAYDHEVGEIEVCQTHISVVFLAGDYAYKIKKPVDLGFVDYATLAKRHHFCEREVALNNRLAPAVYLEVVAIVVDAQGRHRFDLGGDGGEPVEWAVRMRRLDEANTLGCRLANDAVDDDLFRRLGHRLATFHDQARRGPEVDEAARFETVEANALDNFSQSADHVGDVVDGGVFSRVERLMRRRLAEQASLIGRRARQGMARDTHGDLRLEHVYLSDKSPGEDSDEEGLYIVDCIEFNDDLRFADPVSDTAFLAMDLGIRGYDAEAQMLWQAYFEARDDEHGPELVDFYVAYRSCVRAKVHGMKAGESEVPDAQRQRARCKARAHWLYALWCLEEPQRGPAILMLAGLPAAGKSTLGRKLVAQGRADELIESDRVRKELAGLSADDDATAKVGQGIYTPEFTQRTYEEVARQVEAAVAKGRRVAVAATFVRDAHRRQFVALARRLGVPVHFLECQISEEESIERLRAREDDVSDAGVAVYRALKEQWEPPSAPVARVHRICDTGSSKIPEHGDEDRGDSQEE